MIIIVAVAEAAAPLVPVGLLWTVKLILAVVIAALASLGRASFKKHLDPSFRTIPEVKEYLHIPLVAAVPRNGNR